MLVKTDPLIVVIASTPARSLLDGPFGPRPKGRSFYHLGQIDEETSDKARDNYRRFLDLCKIWMPTSVIVQA